MNSRLSLYPTRSLTPEDGKAISPATTNAGLARLCSTCESVAPSRSAPRTEPSHYHSVLSNRQAVTTAPLGTVPRTRRAII
jgi:hypothetical protein